MRPGSYADAALWHREQQARHDGTAAPIGMLQYQFHRRAALHFEELGGVGRQRRRRWQWRTCANCLERPVAGCLCWPCVRAALLPLLLAGLVARVLSW